MQRIDPPPRPMAVSQLPKEQQAQAAATLYSMAAGVAGECLKTRDVLIDWIKGE